MQVQCRFIRDANIGDQMSRVLIIGVGGIGGTVAGHLTEVGADVTAVTTNTQIHAAVLEHGFRLTEGGEQRSVQGTISLGIPRGEIFDTIILATQPPSVEDAARGALDHLADDGNMVCLQNGLCEYRIADLVGSSRVIGGIVAWGGSMPQPGVYERTAPGGFTLGRIDGSPDDAVRALGTILEAVGPVTYTANLAGSRWSKLAINCVISSMGTIGGERLGRLVRVRRYRRLGLEIISEAVKVAAAEGVVLEKVAGTIDPGWIALTNVDRRRTASASLTAKHALILAVGLRYRRLRSSMLQAIERGRTPAIDFLNGEIVRRGLEHGINTPVNRDITETVHAIARGEISSSIETLDAVCQRARSLR